MRKLWIVLSGLALAGPVHPAHADSDWPPRNKPGAIVVMEYERSAFSSEGAAARGKKGAEAGDKEKGRKQAEEPLRPKLSPARGNWRWTITKDHWSEDDERGFAEFIRLIGESDCGNVHDCLTSPVANPRFHANHPRLMQFYADCADLPYVLRAYYAWQQGLPFSFSIRYWAHPRLPGNDAKLTGNKIIERYDIVGPGPDPRLALPAVSQFVSTEHFRIPPDYKGTVLPDYYPVRISKESIKTGTVIFDPDGHIAIVYKVTEDGRIHYIDSHPDNSLTRGIFNREFGRAEPQMGAGFKRWRPQRLEGATKAPDGSLVGGRITLARDEELADWSDEQFYGNVTPRPKLWSDAVFEIEGHKADFHDYVRLRLAPAGFKFNPIDELRTSIRQLCRDLHYRVASVNAAINAGIHNRPAPDRLPKNIYATQGYWETYSTPSRDARLKTTFEELRDEAERFLTLAEEGGETLNYAGTNLRQDLLDLYRDETGRCSITYKRSDGSPVVLSFDEIKRRLFKMSFDPHHCVERRWGAYDPSELKTCQDDRVKTMWYEAQERLRNQLVRTYGEAMGWTLAQLQNQSLDIGMTEAPDVDALKVLLDDGSGSAAEGVASVGR